MENHMNENRNPFEGMEVISSYSRAQAIEDGVLVDLSPLAREAGFKYPVAISAGVCAVLWTDGPGQSFQGRAWDLLAVLLYEIHRGQGGARVDFAPLFLMPGRGQDRPAPVQMYALCGPGDAGEPTITIMLPGED
jgi:hypothetical protein